MTLLTSSAPAPRRAGIEGVIHVTDGGVGDLAEHRIEVVES